ncbi:MAG TPA: flagellar basal body-associated protein FliL [Noviherbaspirillum sp.]|jgi:flagellar FliL protein|uniref:flagellar basal body-associated protein FliL n=1 Tax=Noviherbaspirillum sp. TaxID=1926288 RepID=UPI002F92FB1B
MATAPKANAKVVPIDEAAGAAPKKSKKKQMMLAVLAVLLLGGGGAGAAWFFMNKGEHAEAVAEVKHEPGKPPVFIAMEPFTVNLQPENGEQYLQVAVTVQVADETQTEQIKVYTPLVRSRILMLLAAKKPSELATTEGKEKLAGEIAEQIRKPFSPKARPQDVSAVFFTSFVIQ